MALFFVPNDLTKGISKFSSNFYQECAQSESGNVIISPLSVASALALLQQGATGSTFDVLRKGLHLTADKETTATQFFEYYDILRKSAGKSILTIANHVYIQSGCQINPNFKFTSDIEFLNFSNSNRCSQIINHFVAEQTQGKITDVIPPNMLSTDTRAVLINAIYFKGNWQYKFQKNHTKREDFYTSDTTTTTTDFMHIRKNFNYSHIAALDATALEMKYENSDLSFVIVLPNKLTGLSALEQNLKNFDFNKIIGSMYSSEVIVTIPKFKIEFQIKLNYILAKMGMSEIFERVYLDDLLLSKENLAVSDVIHKAFIEVNEEGSIAAAATAVVLGFGSAPRTPAPPKIFRADHPFVYYIIDTQTKTILFNGRMNNPSN